MKLYAVYDGYPGGYDLFENEPDANAWSKAIASNRCLHDYSWRKRLTSFCATGFSAALGIAESPEPGTVIPITVTLGQPWVVEEVWE
jgi:hypothetical protein